jgi:hypothetical protein
MRRQYTMGGTLGLAVHLYTHFKSSTIFIVMMVPYYVLASMATSDILAAAPPCQSAITETLLSS